MSKEKKKETLETIFGNPEKKSSRGLVFYMSIIFLAFVSGIVGTLASFMYVFPYLEKEGIYSFVDTFVDTQDNNGDSVRVIEKTEEKTYIEESSIISAVEKVSPAVVSIISKTYYKGMFGQIFSKEGGGTGFIISSNGKILTNKHVVNVEGSEYKVITKDGLEYNVSEISRDPFSDIAILTIVDEDGNDLEGLPVVEIGNSRDLRAGQRVIAIGNALGKYDNSVTYGVISATGRKIVASDNIGGKEELKDLIQTDAAINPGNSGGPLVNISGQVIAINTAVASGENIGFAIPIDSIQPIIRSIEEFGEIKTSYLGVSYRLLNKKTAKALKLPIEQGALLIGNEAMNIKAVDENGPAGKVGLEEGDIITEVDIYPVTEESTLLEILRKYIPGEQVTLRVYRPRLVTIDDIEVGEDTEEEDVKENTIKDDTSADFIDIVVTLGERS